MIPSDLFGLPTHPYPVYEIICNGIVLLGIWQLGRRFKKDGMVFLSYLSLHSAGRFILTFVRQENVSKDGTVIGLNIHDIVAYPATVSPYLRAKYTTH